MNARATNVFIPRLRSRRFSAVSAWAGLAAVLAAGVPAAAQTKVVTTLDGGGTPAPEPVIQEGTLQLSLEDAIAIALERNLDLSLQRNDRTQGLLRVDQSRGIFDTTASLFYSQSKTTSPSASDLEGALVTEDASRQVNFRVQQLTPDGGQLRADLLASRSTTNNEFVFLNPNYFTLAGVEFTQPLLRGFGRTVTKRPILQARLATDIDRELFEQNAALTILSVEEAYWGLVEAREQLKVAEEGLALARELDQRNRIQVEVGTLAPIELVQSEATVATREEEIIRAQAAVGDASDSLLRLLNLDLDRYWDREVVPTTAPETERLAIDLAEALTLAMRERPELRAKELDVRIGEIDVEFFKNQLLPRLDFTVNYASRGRAGRGTTTDPVTGQPVRLDTDLADGFDQVRQLDFVAWQADLSVVYPIQNREAKAQSAIAGLAVDRAKTELEQLRLLITTEVRATARAVNTAAQQIESARASRRLQERNLEAEQKRYENGMSTSFQVTQIQEDVTAARSREVTAITTYRTALARYYRAIGRLLEEAGIELVAQGEEAS